MSKLLKYYIGLNREDQNSPLIFSTTPPYLVGKIWTFKDQFQFLEFKNNYSGLGIVSILGYKIAVTLYTTFSGRLSADPLIVQTIENILNEMAEFYLKERVEQKPGLFAAYKL